MATTEHGTARAREGYTAEVNSSFPEPQSAGRNGSENHGMNSPVDVADQVEFTHQGLTAKTAGLELRLVGPGQERRAVAHFRRAVALCEVVVDLLTITLAVVLGYFIYDHSDLGKHIYYAPRIVLAV